MAPALKQQSSLTSFFSAKKPGAVTKSSSNKESPGGASFKENTGNSSSSGKQGKEKPSPSLSPASTKKHSSPAATQEQETSSLHRKKRRVILDEDDEDDNNEQAQPQQETDPPTETSPETKQDETNNDDHDDSTMKVDEEEKKEVSKESNDDDKEKPPPKTSPKSAKTASKLTSNINKKTKANKKVASKKSSDDDDDDSSTKAAASLALEESSMSKSTTKKATTTAGGDDDNNNKLTTSKPRKNASTLLSAAPKEVPSDEKLLKQISDTAWPASSVGLPYLFLCQTLSQIEAITGRLQIQSLVTALLRQTLLRHPQDLYPLIYLASNSVAPAYECVELGIGDSLLIKAIGEATGTNANMVKSKYETVGDLGTVAMAFKGKQKTLGGFFQAAATNKPKVRLTAQEVLTVFREIAKTKGNQSQKWKVDKIKRLLVKATDPLETKYIIRGLQGKLRIGLAESTVLIALAHSLALTTPETVEVPAEKPRKADLPDEAQQYMDKTLPYEKRMEGAVSIIKKAYSEVPSYDAVLDAALKVPLESLHKSCTLTPGIPVAPMLAKPTKSIQEVLKRLNGVKFTCEYKYDGERAQVHLLPDGTTKVFSRNLLDTSVKYPEVPLYVREAAQGVESCVLDAEVVAFNKENGRLVPFQILSTRKKTEESAETAKVQVIVQAFDLMFLNGESLLNQTLAHRRELMKKHFQPVQDKFQYAVSLDHKEDGDTTVIEEFLDQAVKGQCEGLMVKTLEENAYYEPSRRSLNWLKLKKDYLEGLGDSVDLVPLGAYHGRGKRTGVYGAYLLACFDPDTEEFQSVCKIGTGFSDEDLKNLAAKLNEHVIPTKSRQYNVSDQLACDVWFDAVQVWEVRAADLSKSSAHRGAEGKVGEAGRGIGLRFPRFERLRDDKRPYESTTCDQILEMYYRQDTVAGGSGGHDDEDDGI